MSAGVSASFFIFYRFCLNHFSVPLRHRPQLRGVVVSTRHTVSVELCPFNDRQYNRDLIVLCQRVNERQVRLPDGRLLVFSVKQACRPILHGQKRLIA
jgi:hypothetical protein